jgi:succinate dehydrogenase hydrophobic anchor subunit
VIDWFNLAANSLWILGCALALASFSYASWRASLTRVKLGDYLESSGVRQALYLAGLLFCVGLAILTVSLLGRILWAILSLAFGAGVILATLRKTGVPKETSGSR